jgi:large repetitive protein
MKWRKFMHDSFKSNDMAWSGVTSVSALTSDLYYHYFDTDGTEWKLSGASTTTASGRILENSDTTSIVVSPTAKTGSTAATQQLTVVNQDGVNVTSECTYSATTALCTVTSGGLITFVTTGVTSVKVTHPDIPGSPTTVPIVIYWTGNMSITAGNGVGGIFTGYTGGTYQAAATMDTGGYVVTTVASWVSENTSIATVGLHTGLITFVYTGSTTVGATYPTGSFMSRGVTVYWPVRTVGVTPAVLTGTTTGQTQQLAVVDQNGRNILSACSFSSGTPAVATVSAAGLVTFTGSAGSTVITVTHRDSSNTGTAVMHF